MRAIAYKKLNIPEPYSSTWNYEVAVYRGEDMIFSGTVKTAAEFLGVQKRTVRYHITPAGQRRADRRKKQESVLRVIRL